MFWEGLVAIFAAIKAGIDLINPWSQYWVNKRTRIDSKREAAQTAMDAATAAGDQDAFLDHRADKHGSD